MVMKIEDKIIGYSVETETTKKEPEVVEVTADNNVVKMHDKLQRRVVLVGKTYKIKTPLSEHALYITINDIILNDGTEHEQRRPFEMFINSKNMDHFQWIVALTRIVSAVFRKGGDITFLAEELSAVFDPRGGYFKKGGRFMPSLVAEIGDVLDQHLRLIGMIPDEAMDEHLQKHLDEKRAEYERLKGAGKDESSSDFPSEAELCVKCSTKAMIQMDGCLTCLNCGESKCG